MFYLMNTCSEKGLRYPTASATVNLKTLSLVIGLSALFMTSNNIGLI